MLNLSEIRYVIQLLLVKSPDGAENEEFHN